MAGAQVSVRVEDLTSIDAVRSASEAPL